MNKLFWAGVVCGAILLLVLSGCISVCYHPWFEQPKCIGD